MSGISLNRNIAALRISRSLEESTRTLSSTYERLSTGMRINRAADDAAGLAIADRLSADAVLYQTSIRNINDGISMINIANGALDTQAGILTRMAELAEQGANGIYSEEQYAALDNEYKALLKEYARIGATTEFNDIELLRGDRGDNTGNLYLQAGIDGSLDSLLQVEAADSSDFSGFYDVAQLSDALFAHVDSKDTNQLLNRFDDQISYMTITDENGQEREIAFSFYGLGCTGAISQPQVGGPSLCNGNATLDVAVYQKVSDTGGLGAQTAAGANGEITDAEHEWVYSGSISNMEIDQQSGKIIANTQLAMTFENGTVNATADFNFEGLTFGRSNSTFTTLQTGEHTAIDFTGLERQSRALGALDTVKNRIDELSSIRGELGAVESRLKTAISLSMASRENVLAAESRIRDVDIAEETAKLTSTQILQQASVSTLRLANRQTQLLLSLIQRAPP